MSYPHPQPVPAPKKKRNVGLIIAIVAVAMVAFCCGITVLVVAMNPGDNNNPPGTGGGGTVQAGVSNVGPNQPGRDGMFEFTVTGMECGVKQLGESFMTKQAQGQFCLVKVTVRNIGNEPRTFSSSSQHAYNPAGQRYDADGSAGMYLDQDSRAFLEDINPGNSVNGTLVFDIPPDATIVRLELHDSPFSGGVTINMA